MTTLDLMTRAKLAALRHRVERALLDAREYLTTAPDDRPASDSPIRDTTADIVLHPARIAVSNAYRPVMTLHKALEIVDEAEARLAVLEAATVAWSGNEVEEVER